MTEPEKRAFGQSLAAVGVSVVLSCLDFLSFLAMIPVLVIAERNHDGKRYWPVLAAGLLGIGIAFLRNKDLLTDQAGLLVVLVSLFIPVVLWFSAIIWVKLEGMRKMKRFALAILPGCALAMGMLAYFASSSQAVLDFDSLMAESFQSVFKDLESAMGMNAEGGDYSSLYHVVVKAMGAMLVPLVMVASGFVFWLSQGIVEKDKIVLSSHVAEWKLKNDAIWIFLVLWMAVILLSFAKASYFLEAVLLNLAGGITVFYGIQGFCIILFLMRRKHTDYTAGRLFGMLLAFILLVPGLNALVVVALPLLGVTETWITYRKKNE